MYHPWKFQDLIFNRLGKIARTKWHLKNGKSAVTRDRKWISKKGKKNEFSLDYDGSSLKIITIYPAVSEESRAQNR